MKCLQTGGLRVEVGRHLYRTGFLRANGLQFCKGILHEDEEFTPRVLLQAQRVVLTGQEIYYYDNCRAGSITHAEGLSTRRVQQRLRMLQFACTPRRRAKAALFALSPELFRRVMNH